MNAEALRTISRYLSQILLVAAAYYMTGRMGLTLAVPPGYATAVWPPSGVVLAAILTLGYRFWPGVFLGSLSVNLFISFDPTDHSTMMMSGIIAAIIACGATLQALGGAWLVRQFILIPNALERLRDIGLLVLLGGPIGCLINASVSVTTLVLAGAMPWQNYGFNWLTWWVGDSIGVIVFTPVLMLLFTPRLNASVSRKIQVSLAMCIAFALAIYVFFTASHLEQKTRQAHFERQAQDLQQRLDMKMSNYQDAMNSIARFYAASDQVSEPEFQIFVQNMLVQYPGLHMLSWNKRVLRDERKNFETAMRRNGNENFTIQDRKDSGELMVADVREEYFPVTYIAPTEPNRKALGYDTSTEAQRKKALDDSRVSGKPTATGRTTIVQDDDRQYAFIIYQPIYTNIPAHKKFDQRDDGLEGYIAGVFLFSEMLEDVALLAHESHLDFVLTDSQAGAGLNLLYDSRTPDHKAPPEKNTFKSNTLQWGGHIKQVGRDWALRVVPDMSYNTANQSWTVWFVLSGGLIFTGLFGMFLLLITGRTDVIQRIVEEKRKEESKLIAIIEDSSDYIGMADLKGNLQYHNRSAKRLLGYPDDYDMSGLKISDMHPPWAAKLISEKAIPTTFEKGFWQGDTALLHRDGHEITVLQTLTLHRDAQDTPLCFTTIIRDISERKKTELLLKTSEETFRSAMDYAPIGMALLSPQGEWLKINSALCKSLGYTESELLKMNFQTVTHPEDLTADLDYVEQMLAGTIETYHMEKRYFHKDGHIIWVLLHVSLVRNEDHTPKHFISQIQDITSLKEEAEKRRISAEELRLSEERLHLAASGTSDGLWDWDLLTNKLYYSPRFMSELGYTEYELPHTIETFTRLLHPDDIAPTYAAVAASHEHIAPYNTEYRMCHKDGHYIWHHARGKTLWDADGKPIRMTGFTTNIDTRKRAQLASKKAHDELDLIFNNVNARICFKDDKNTILRLNRSAAESMGGEVQDYENKNIFELFPELAQKSFDEDMEVIRSGHSKLGLVQKFTPQNAPHMWLSTDKIPYIDSVLDIRGVFVVTTDITELKHSEEQREALVAKLTESNLELERFAYVASHDMQEPLRMIANFGEIIGKEYKDKIDEDGQEYIGIITDAALRMQHMISDLLEYARIGNEGIRFTDIDASEELQHVMTNLSASIQERAAKITHDALPHLRANAVQFMRLLQNLIGNGLKYQTEGTIPEVHVGVEDRGDTWQFSIRDNGIGMKEEHLKHVFEPYRRLHTWSEFKGTGIGLAVCKKIVENHGGGIWVTSELGVGSVFYFTIPKNNTVYSGVAV